MNGQLSGVLITSLVILFLAIVLKPLLAHLKLVWALWSVPGPRAYPIIGNILQLKGGVRQFYQLMKDSHKRYGNLFRIWFGPYPMVYLSGSEEVKPLLSSSIHIEKSDEYSQLNSWLGTGLLTGGGKKWHMRRKLLTGAFHTTILESYVCQLQIGADALASKIDSVISKTKPDEWSEAMDVVPLTKLSALDAICETIMGIRVNALEGSNTEYVHAIHRVTSLLQIRFISPWLRTDFMFNRSSIGKEYNKLIDFIQTFIEKVIKKRKEEYYALEECDHTNNKRKSFLDLLLALSNKGKDLSDEDIKEEVNTFMFAGHDTTSAGMSWCLFALGNKPEMQERILEEKRSVLGDGNDTQLTISNIEKLEYFGRFLKEVLRLYPPVPIIGRKLESPLKIGDHTFPAGTTFTISPFLLHRDPAYFTDPDTFNPDRFIDFENKERIPYAYAPFSAGSRNCIGQKFALLELKIVLLKLIERFEIRSLKSMEEIVVQGEIVLNSPDGIYISFRKRRTADT